MKNIQINLIGPDKEREFDGLTPAQAHKKFITEIGDALTNEEGTIVSWSLLNEDGSIFVDHTFKEGE